LLFLFSVHHATKKGEQPLAPLPRDEEEECVSNKEVSAMMKAMTELFTKNQ
jgi:hypothetical protein